MYSRTESADETHIHVLEVAGNSIVGGMEKYVYSLVQNLPSSHFRVSCLAPFESAFTASLRQIGSDVYITRMENDPLWRSIQFTTELIRQQHIDLVHAHLPRGHVLAALAGELNRIPVVATIHGMDIDALDLSICHTAGTHLTVVCYDAYTQALSLGVPLKKVTMIPNGVDTRIYNSNRNGASFRKALGISQATPLVGFVGRLAWEKGPDQFIRLAAVVHEAMPDVHFAIVGEGPMEDELRQMTRDTHLENVFHLAGLWTNTWDVYPAFDILAQTSRVEGMPFALLEGMACGRPAAAMGVGGVPEIIEVGTTGLLSAGGDWEGLAQGILKLLSNPERMKEMGHAARKRIEENFEWHNSVQKMINLFYRLLGKKVTNKMILDSRESWSLLNQENQAVDKEPGAIFPKRE